MSLLVAVNGVFESYFHPNNMGQINLAQNQKVDCPLPRHYSNVHKKIKKRRHNVYAKDIMSTPVKSIDGDINIYLAMNYMVELNIHHLLIFKEQSLVGIISDRDILEAINFIEANDVKVLDIMTPKVLVCELGTEIRIIAKLMNEENLSCLPVVDEEKNICGVVTKKDLLDCLIHNMPLEVDI